MGDWDKAELADCKAHIKELEDMLRERDGGTHDADCKAIRWNDESMCNCGHNDVVELLTSSSDTPKHR